MTTAYRPAPEVERIAERVIARHHPHLAGEHVEYVFRDKAARSKGRTVFAKARLVSGLNAYLAQDEHTAPMETPESFFVVEVAADVWDVLDAGQREALVAWLGSDAEDDDGGLGLVGHDVEDFAAVVRRHGLWRPEVEALVKAAIDHQPDLFS